MELADFGARFVTAVEDLSGVWPSISEALDARLPLRSVPLRNKFGNTLTVDKLPVQYLLSDDARLKRLRPYAHSPVTWFRNPFACLILVSCEDAEDYRRQWRMQLKGILDREKDSVGGLAEWVICYVRPLNADALSKGPKKVMEALRHDFSTRRRERCVRLDLMTTGSSKVTVAGLDELERLLREAVKASFEARQAAYDDEVRKLMDKRLEKGWSFSTLFLVKDSLAIMLEAGGLLEDAVREYSELEACYLEALASGGPLAGAPFGGNQDGDDVAQLLKASWRETRRAVLHKGNIAEFHFRQYMFACQARLLLKLERPAEVVIKGLKFIQTFSEILSRREASGQLPNLFREAWAFSACLSLASVTARSLLPSPSMPPVPIPPLQPSASGKLPPADASSTEASPPRPHHRRAMTEDVHDGRGGASALGRAYSSQAPGKGSMTTSAMENGDTSLPQQRPQTSAALQGDRGNADVAGKLPQQLSLTPVRTGRGVGNHAEANGGGHSRHQGQSSDGSAQSAGLDWDLGVSTKLEDTSAEDPHASGWGVTTPEEKVAAVKRAAVCLLGHLYAGARLELLHLGHALGLSAHCEPVSPMSTPGRAGSRQRSPFGHLPAPAYFQAAPQMLSKEAVQSSLASAPSGLLGPEHGSGKIQSTTPTDFEVADGDHSKPRGQDSPMGIRKDSLPEASQDLDGGTQTSTPRSLRIQHSEASQTSNDGSAASGAPAGFDVSEAQMVERELERASDSDSMQGDSHLANGGVLGQHLQSRGSDGPRPAWVSDWRLKLALADAKQFQDLWVELSGAAGRCYVAAGRRRVAALMRAEVAEVLVARGLVARAAALVEQQCACSWLRAGPAWLLPSCPASLPAKRASCRCPHRMPASSCCPCPQCAGPSWTGPAPPGLLLQILRRGWSLWRSPAPSVLRLAKPVLLRGVALQLGVLQEMRVVVSPRKPTEQPQKEPQGGTGSSAATPTAATPVVTPINSSPVKGHEHTSAHALNRFKQDWRETEELECRLLSCFTATTSSHAPSADNHNHPSISSHQPGSTHSYQPSTGHRLTETNVPHADQEEPTPSSEAVLQPGRNLLIFSATPLKRGLYTLKHLSAQLDHLQLHVPLRPAPAFHIPGLPLQEDDSPDLLTPQAPKAESALELGSLDPTGRIAEVPVVLHARSCRPRMRITAVALAGTLIAGHAQHLGLVLYPLHDTLQDGSLHVDSVDPDAGEAHSSSDGPAGPSGDPPQQLSFSQDGPNLPDWAWRDPSLLWIPVSLGHIPLRHETVRVTSFSSAPPMKRPFASLESLRRPGPPGTPGIPSTPHNPASPHPPSYQPRPCVNIDVSLSYMAGCPRSHVSRLSVPLTSPFRIHSNARELPGKRVALQFTVISQVPWPAMLHAAVLHLQQGFATGNLLPGSRLPLQVQPYGSVGLLTMLNVGRLRASAALHAAASCLELHYQLLTQQPAEGLPCEVLPNWEQQEQHAAGRPLNLCLPPMPPFRGHSQVQPEQQGASSLRHTFVLEMSLEEGTPRSPILIRLLGPLVARVGEPLVLCWRLERSAGLPNSHDSANIQYQAQAT
ncbi:hypothetical protein WJX84_005283, partial [Apatococcus fuscideae]